MSGSPKPVPERWAVAADEWIVYLTAADRTSETRLLRRGHVQRVARSIGVADPWAVTAEQLVAWFGAQSWQTETRRSYRSSLRSFYDWAVLAGHVEESPARRLPTVKPAPPNPRPAPDSVYHWALASASTRERLALRLAAEHGMRRGEIVLVHRRDLVEDLTGWSLVVHGKGRKTREVPLTDEVSAMLRALPDGYAFPGAVEGHMSARWMGKLINRLLPDDWTIHKLRHRAGTKWWEASDHDLFVVQQLLGHASPTTTQAYVRVGRERLRDTVNRAAAA